MKFTYNYGQVFWLEEIDFFEGKLVFSTNNGMGMFGGEKGEKVVFSVPYESIYELQNIPKILYDYLDNNNLMYWCD